MEMYIEPFYYYYYYIFTTETQAYRIESVLQVTNF